MKFCTNVVTRIRMSHIDGEDDVKPKKILRLIFFLIYIIFEILIFKILFSIFSCF